MTRRATPSAKRWSLLARAYRRSSSRGRSSSREPVVESLAALGPDDVDLLVCGSRGYGPARRVLLGGVSSPLIRRARLPVAVVPRATTVSTE